MTHTEDGDALVVIESGNGTGDVARHDGDDGGRHEASAGGKEVWNSLGKMRGCGSWPTSQPIN